MVKKYLLFQFLLIVGTTAELRIDSLVPLTTCPNGNMRAQEDSFVVSGTVDTSGEDVNKWHYIDFLSFSPSLKDFVTVCFADLKKCSNTTEQDGCHCLSQGGNIYELYIRQIADVSYSGVSVKLSWNDGQVPEPNILKNSTERNVSYVYDQTESHSLEVGDMDFTKSLCEFSVNGASVQISYCCTGSHFDCETTIQHEASSVSGTPCSYLNATGKGTYKFLYSVCNDSNSFKQCEAKAEAQEQDEDDLGLILGITIPVVVIIIIGGVVIIVLRHKKRLCFRKTEEVSKQDAPEPTVKPAEPDSGQHPRRLPPIDQKETNDKTSKNEKSNKRGTSPRRNQVENGDGDGKTKGHDSTDGKNQDQKNSANDHKTDRIPDGQDETNVDIEAQKKKGTPAVFRPQPTRKE